MIHKKKILVLKGGYSVEREISLNSAIEVEKSLNNLKYEWDSFDLKNRNEIINFIKICNNFDLIFNCIHGIYGEDGCIQGLMNMLGIAYTGSGLLPSSILMNKIMTKKLCSSVLNINIADGCFIKRDIYSNNYKYDESLLKRPHIVKPVCEGSSYGVSFFDAIENFFDPSILDEYKGVDFMLEEYIPGIDVTVGVISGKAAGVMEILINRDKIFYDVESKYSQDKLAKHIYPARIDEATYKEIMNQSSEIFSYFGCRGVIRVDYRYDPAKNRAVLLEVNTSPGLSKKSLIPDIINHNMISMDDLIEKIIDDL
ncbi:D-alanine--D-alanine ligase [Anaplasmataceae bacterium AB001_6]|nr:D-alanine--D-alanine ligase [Anaplasmataceae bacterium AB001_6]